MRQISSSTTFLHKRVFPKIWFGFGGIFGIAIVTGVAVVKQDIFLVVLTSTGPLILATYGYWLMRRTAFCLADEVWWDGGDLIVKNDGEAHRIALADCAEIQYGYFQTGARVTIVLARGSPLGPEIRLLPEPLPMLPIEPKVVKELRLRVSELRSINAV